MKGRFVGTLGRKYRIPKNIDVPMNIAAQFFKVNRNRCRLVDHVDGGNQCNLEAKQNSIYWHIRESIGFYFRHLDNDCSANVDSSLSGKPSPIIFILLGAHL